MAYGKNAKIELTGQSVELEKRLLPITAELNEKPLRVNYKTWKANRDAAELEAIKLNLICQNFLLDPEFRANAPADCVKAIRNEFQRKYGEPWKPSKKGTSGEPSTDATVLTELANGGLEIADHILTARSAISCLSQLNSWQVYAQARAVQPIWDSLGQPHGRYTSDDPSLNNRIVPIRETIEPDEGYSFLSIDLGQAEYVVWAALAKDEYLSDAFLKGSDFHTETGEIIRHEVPDWNLRGQTPRAAGKTINFAVLYLMQAYTLSKQLGCSVEVAEKILTVWRGRSPRAAAYIREVLGIAKKQGFVETFYGRRRNCEEYLTLKNRHQIHELEKTVWHHHNAGTAAEYLKWKQVYAWEKLREEGYTRNAVRLSLQMYDELIWMVRDDLLPGVAFILNDIFHRVEPGFLPMPVTVKCGKNWKETSK